MLSPGGSLRLLAASLPGLGRLLVDKEDLQLVRIRIMMIIMMIMMMMGMVMKMIMMFALLHCLDLENFLSIKRIYNWSGSGSG